MDSCPPGSSGGDIPDRLLEWISISYPKESPDTGIEPESPARQADTLPLSHQGSPLYI